MFQALDYGITGKAIKNKLLVLNVTNPRDFTHDKHQTVDDSPYGGGPGMVMKYQPISDALVDITAREKDQQAEKKIIYLSPQGKQIKQQDINLFAKNQHLVFICGRYEGIDERLVDACIDEEWSLGDYVLSGGELAAMTIIDAIIRQIPGALGDRESAINDSFFNGILDYPHYTRPEFIEGQQVPEVLLSGDHKKIANWRMYQAIKRTLERRPDLLEEELLDKTQKQMLEQIKKENN